jgi:phosphocarrier protein HPr
MSMDSVKRAHVVVPWEPGLHLRPAARLVRLALTFRSSLRLRCGSRVANLRSILSVVTLCAGTGTAVEVEAAGEDEQEALAAIEQAFAPKPVADTEADDSIAAPG